MSLRRLNLKLVFTFFFSRAISFLVNISFLLRCSQTLLIHFFLSILLIACCGNMTPHAIDYGKAYKNVYKIYKPNVLALLIGLVSRIQSLHGSVVSRKFASSVLVKKPWNIKIRFIYLTLRVLFTYFAYLFIRTKFIY